MNAENVENGGYEKKRWRSADCDFRINLRRTRRKKHGEIRKEMLDFLEKIGKENGIQPEYFGGFFYEKCAERYNSVLDFSNSLGLNLSLKKITEEELNAGSRFGKIFSEKIISTDKFEIEFHAVFNSQAKFCIKFSIFGKEESTLAEYLETGGRSTPYHCEFVFPPEPEKIAHFMLALKTKTAPFVDEFLESKIKPWDEQREKMIFEHSKTMKILEIEAAGIEALISESFEDLPKRYRVSKGFESFRVRYALDEKRNAVAIVPRGFDDIAAFASAFRKFVEKGESTLDGIEFRIEDRLEIV